MPREDAHSGYDFWGQLEGKISEKIKKLCEKNFLFLRLGFLRNFAECVWESSDTEVGVHRGQIDFK